MMVGESPSEALDRFVRAVDKSLIEPLKRNQARIGLQKELRESKRYKEAENRIAEFAALHFRFKDNQGFAHKVMEALSVFQASRMVQFVETGRTLAPQESPELMATLEPYYAFLEPVQPICNLQLGLVSQAKLKKLVLPYDEITATLSEVGGLANKMPRLLMEDVFSNLG